MRVLEVNGYLDEMEFWGDEITPEKLRDALYKDKDSEVLLRINSYGGSCTAAVRMYDMIKNYPGKVDTQVSGVAASAAVVLLLAGKSASVTPGSLVMVHNPSTIAFGEIADMEKAIDLLKAAKDSILNIYETRSTKSRAELSHMMDAVTWMDAKTAVANGFAGEVTGGTPGVKNEAGHPVPDREQAEKLVALWAERSRRKPTYEEPKADKPEPAGVPAEQLYKRLNLIK